MNLIKINLVYFCTRFHVYIHVYALLLQSRGLSLVQISTIESVVIGMIFLMEVPTGVVADRIGRKWSITASTFLLMGGEAVFYFSRSYEAYLVTALLTGTGFAFASGATEALIYESLPVDGREDHMKQAMGRYHSIGQIAFFFSPLVGGWLVRDLTQAQFDTAILLTVGILFVGGLLSLTLVEPVTAWHTERKSALAILRAGFADVRHNPVLRRWVGIAIFTTPFGGTLVTTFAAPYFAEKSVSPVLIGGALSIGSLLAALTQRSAYRVEKWLGAGRAILLLTLLPSFLYFGLALVVHPGLAWLLVVTLYGIMDMKSPLVSAYQNTHIAPENRATTLSLMNMGVSFFIALAAPVYAAFGIPLAFWLIAGVILLAGVMLRPDYLIGTNG